MTYNGDGLRQTRSSGGTTTTYTWDVGQRLPVVLDDGTQYLYGIGRVARVTAGGTFYYLADGLGFGDGRRQQQRHGGADLRVRRVRDGAEQ